MAASVTLQLVASSMVDTQGCVALLKLRCFFTQNHANFLSYDRAVYVTAGLGPGFECDVSYLRLGPIAHPRHSSGLEHG